MVGMLLTCPIKLQLELHGKTITKISNRLLTAIIHMLCGSVRLMVYFVCFTLYCLFDTGSNFVCFAFLVHLTQVVCIFFTFDLVKVVY